MSESLEMTSFSEAGLHGRRVLVADEVAQTRWSYVGLLRGAGARVTEARDGLEALALARADRPDLILADVSMPRLDGLGLCAALREEPALEAVPVVLLSEGSPPQAVSGDDVASRPLVEAVFAALAANHRTPAPRPGRPRARSVDATPGEAPERVPDDEERENTRAQAAVAMHREPANRMPQRAAEVWRLRISGAPKADGSASGFGADIAVMSRILGLGFLALLLGTIGLITWRTLATETPPPPERVVQPDLTEPRPATPAAPADEEAPPTPVPIMRYSGALRAGVDEAIAVGEGQGVLELNGPEEVTVFVDGEDAGRLPVALPLDQGRHRVRYQAEDASTDRFYFVKSGFTRELTIITRPGGFVDAR